MSEKSFKSMTGYAVVEKKIQGKTYKAHLKTVNHRFTELRCRMPRSWMPFEVEAKSYFQKNLERGSFDFWIEESSDSSSKGDQGRVSDFFSKLNNALKEVEGVSQFAVPNPMRALILSRFPDLWLHEKTTDEQVISQDEFGELIGELCKKVDETRTKEGANIQQALRSYAGDLRQYRDLIANAYGDIRKEWERQYRERLLKVAEDLKLASVPEERIMQEILVLGEKRDVAEELQRIEGHLGTLDSLLRGSSVENVGKRLEFLLQELHREWTTLGNKIQNLNVAKHVLEAKLALEKIREQALNLV